MSLTMYRIVYTYNCNELETKSWWHFHSVKTALNEKLNFKLNFSVWFATRMDGDLYFVLIIELLDC